MMMIMIMDIIMIMIMKKMMISTAIMIIQLILSAMIRIAKKVIFYENQILDI